MLSAKSTGGHSGKPQSHLDDLLLTSNGDTGCWLFGPPVRVASKTIGRAYYLVEPVRDGRVHLNVALGHFSEGVVSPTSVLDKADLAKLPTGIRTV